MNVQVEALPTTIQVEQLAPVPDVIERARSGDRAAFAELYDTHSEDLTSEVFTRGFANIHRYKWQGKSFLAWLTPSPATP